MELNLPLLVISDLHIGHPASLVRDIEQVAPLFKDFATVVFNGDTVEMLTRQNRKHALRQIESIGRTCLEQGATPIYINGNHDPMISSANHLDFYNDAVLVTHGDILFHELAPWGREADIMGREHTRILRRLDRDALRDFEQRLFAVREASIVLAMHELNYPQGKMAKLLTVLQESWPPWRVFRIIHYWMQTPHRAAMLSHIFRPFARYLLIGHTHYAGIWECEKRTIINTGAFLPLSGRLAALLEPQKLTIRKIVQRKGKFVLGRKKAEFRVDESYQDDEAQGIPRHLQENLDELLIAEEEIRQNGVRHPALPLH